VLNEWVGKNPEFTVRRVNSYREFAARQWQNVFGVPLRDTDRFVLYAAGADPEEMSAHEKCFADRCWKTVCAVYAVLLWNALNASSAIDYDELKRRADKILRSVQTVHVRRRSVYLGRIGRCKRLCATFAPR